MAKYRRIFRKLTFKYICIYIIHFKLYLKFNGVFDLRIKQIICYKSWVINEGLANTR